MVAQLHTDEVCRPELEPDRTENKQTVARFIEGFTVFFMGTIRRKGPWGKISTALFHFEDGHILDIRPVFSRFKEMATQGNLIPVHGEFLADTETPVSAYLKIRG